MSFGRGAQRRVAERVAYLEVERRGQVGGEGDLARIAQRQRGFGGSVVLAAVGDQVGFSAFSGGRSGAGGLGGVGGFAGRAGVVHGGVGGQGGRAGVVHVA